jgi:hypothetical protein
VEVQIKEEEPDEDLGAELGLREAVVGLIPEAELEDKAYRPPAVPLPYWQEGGGGML